MERYMKYINLKDQYCNTFNYTNNNLVKLNYLIESKFCKFKRSVNQLSFCIKGKVIHIYS